MCGEDRAKREKSNQQNQEISKAGVFRAVARQSDRGVAKMKGKKLRTSLFFSLACLV
jgi:hypothetical protein